MSEPQDDEIERSFDRIDGSERHRTETLGYGSGRQGYALTRRWAPQLADNIIQSRTKSHDKALWAALKGTSADDLAWRLLNAGISVAVYDKLGANKRGKKDIYDILSFVAYQLAPKCKDRRLLPKIGSWGVEMLRTLPIFEVDGEVLVLSGDLNDFMDDVFVQAIRANPLLYPLREPPTPWTQVNKGGLPPDHWAHGISLISGHHHHRAEAAVRYAIAHDRMDQVLKALNYLQSPAFIINQPLLAFMQRISRPLPPKPAKGEIFWKAPAREQWKERQALEAWRLDLIVAQAFAGKRFWVPLRFDFRGRINPIPHFNFTREDHVRALFLFADGDPIGEEGLKWLKAHVAARADGVSWSIKPSKLNFEGRIAWTESNLPLLRKIGEAVLRGDDPTVLEWALPPEDDERYQFIAACVELVQALDVGPGFKTRLPLVFDATCSGLQHLSGMRRDESVGRLVNLTKPNNGGDPIQILLDGDTIDAVTEPDGPNDFYGIMALALWNKLRKRPHLRDLVDGPLDRKIVKQPVMSYFYGSTRIGMSDQIVEIIEKRNRSRKEKKKIRRGDIFLPYRLAEKVYELLEQEAAPKAAETLRHLRSLVKLCNSNGKSLGFDMVGQPILNSYFKPDIKRVAIRWNGRRRDLSWIIGDTDEIDPEGAENGIAANFVHAADAAHLRLFALAAAKEGLLTVTVHDCYGTIAPRAARLKELVPQCWERLHRHNLLNDIWQAARRTLPRSVELPLRLSIGDLDLAEAAQNFFFIN
jgi:DNA-directed RNA polymerase